MYGFGPDLCGTHPASSKDICVWSASVGRRPPSTSSRVSEGVVYVKACCPSEGPRVPSAENILFTAPCSSSSNVSGNLQERPLVVQGF